MTLPHRLRRLLIAGACAVLLAPAAHAEPYRLAPGDALDLSIFAQPELSGTHRVREDGVVSLHLIGDVPVAGMTLPEAASAIAAAAEEVFEARASVIAEMAAYRDIYVLGDVARPGAHPFTPGLTVIKALALAGDVRRSTFTGDETGRRIADERRRLLLARARIDEAEATIAAVDAELARLDRGEALALATAGPAVPPDADDPLALQNALIDARREVMARAVDGSTRQQRLAAEEAELFSQRNALVQRQLDLTEENLRDIESLVARGLARRDRQLELTVRAEDFRADTLEIAAFEARARQVAVTAENAAAVAVSRYREALVAERIAAARMLDTATIDFVTSREFLMAHGDPGAVSVGLEPMTLRFEIIRDGVASPAGEADALRPTDVLRATLAPAPAPTQ